MIRSPTDPRIWIAVFASALLLGLGYLISRVFHIRYTVISGMMASIATVGGIIYFFATGQIMAAISWTLLAAVTIARLYSTLRSKRPPV